eukprot:g3866.t1
MLAQFDVVVAQSEADGERFVTAQQGFTDTAPVENVAVASNLKLAEPVLPIPHDALARAALLFQRCGTKRIEASTPCVRLVAASTHEGEEELVARAAVLHQKRLQASEDLRARSRLCSVIVPRHPERAGAIADVLRRKYGLAIRIVPASFILEGRGSSIDALGGGGQLKPAIGSDSDSCQSQDSENGWEDEPSLTIVQGVGALRALYANADIALVGGAMIQGKSMVGQHNVVEPLQHDCVTLHGKYAENDDSFCSLRKSLLTDTMTEAELRSILRPLGSGDTEDVAAAFEQACCDLRDDTNNLGGIHAALSKVASFSLGVDGHWKALDEGRFFGSKI